MNRELLTYGMRVEAADEARYGMVETDTLPGYYRVRWDDAEVETVHEGDLIAHWGEFRS